MELGPMALAAGTHLGSYEILSPLGAGGMGEVYRARDGRLDREVAVKVLSEALAGHSAARQRFEREAKAVASLSHPNILGIHDFGYADAVAYAVMELLNGETLRERLESVRLSPRKAVEIALQVARGLAAAHDRGVVHRDLKPENVFLTTDGQVKVLDFGLAKLARAPATADSDSEVATLSKQTTPGTVMGTVGYMSPEQVRGREVDHRSDVFSFGVVLYEMLAGHRPFARDSAADTMSAILKEEPAALSGRVTDLPPVLDRVLRRCLEKEPAERFQSAHDLAFALEIVAGLESAGDSGSASARPGVEKADTMPSIAVLPFTNMSADPEQEYFCEGMAEEILNALTRLEGLRVAARSSAFRFKHEGRDIRRVGEALNVKTVLEGSVRSAGKRLRVTAQLVNVEDGYHIWSERYDRQMEDVFAIQDDITASIVEVLRGKLVGTAPTLRDRDQPPNLEAYHLYLKGQHNWFRRDKDSLVKATRFFEQAAELDPSYVLAHVGVANAYTSLGYYGAPHAAVSARAHAAIERALTLDPDRAEVRASLGLMHFWLDWDYEGAEREFKRALDQRPDLVLARCWYTFLLYALGRHEESQTCAGKALEQDPLSPYVQMAVGVSQLYPDRGQEAVSALEKAREMDGDLLTTLWLLGLAYGMTGRKPEAVTVLERAATVSGRSPFYVAALAWGCGSANRKADAEALIEELHQRAREEFVAPGFLVWAYAALGATDRAFEWLERSYEARDAHLPQNLDMPFYDAIRPDPRFAEIRRKVMATA
jgi:TolB-like protein/Flp pilus assembly protein TadD